MCFRILQDFIPTEVQGDGQERTPSPGTQDSDSEPSVGFLTPPEASTQPSQLLQQVSTSASIGT
jgi:hypothetical protein